MVSATIAMVIGITMASSRSAAAPTWISACSSTHSATKPEVTGSAAPPSAPDPEGRRRPRHAGGEAAEPVEVALAGGVQHRAGAEEEDGLERRVADREQQRGHQGDVGHGGLAGVAQQQSRRRWPW